jgi:RND family efflux transporter MFP subunit
VHARIESDLGFRVPGKIVGRLIDPGALVHRGQPLMRLDPTNLALGATSARQRLLAAQAEATRAAAEEARQSGLLAEGAISQASYEAARAARDGTAANREAAAAAAHDAELNLDYATLTAEADGIVLEVLAQPGEVVAAGTPIIRLAEAGAREAVVFIPETAVANLLPNATAQVYGTDRSVAARLREVAGAADPITRTFAARFTLQGAAAQAPLGATITLSLATAGGASIQVPLAALHDGGEGTGVWVVTPSSELVFRPVTVTALGEETATLAPSTLTPDDLIVALGAHLLRAGEKVRILKDPS